MHPHLRVVHLVLMRVQRVVSKRPQRPGRVHQNSRHRQRAVHRAPPEQHAPVERDAQERLRPPCHPLHQRVHRDEHERAGGQHHRERVGHGHQHRADEQQTEREDPRLREPNLTAGQRTVLGARDLGVQVAVCDIVQRAASAAERSGGGEEQKHGLDVGQLSWLAGERNSPAERQHEQPDADGAVDTHEAEVRLHACWGVQVDKVARRSVRHKLGLDLRRFHSDCMRSSCSAV
mmetsp:Transcript_8037/g.21305  ORF Transcript_8037/g.21305 Transcript_8037/m.21305 type:complete len:233 (-) Transcript_8037:159-857(-)